MHFNSTYAVLRDVVISFYRTRHVLIVIFFPSYSPYIINYLTSPLPAENEGCNLRQLIAVGISWGFASRYDPHLFPTSYAEFNFYFSIRFALVHTLSLVSDLFIIGLLWRRWLHCRGCFSLHWRHFRYMHSLGWVEPLFFPKLLINNLLPSLPLFFSFFLSPLGKEVLLAALSNDVFYHILLFCRLK